MMLEAAVITFYLMNTDKIGTTVYNSCITTICHWENTIIVNMSETILEAVGS